MVELLPEIKNSIVRRGAFNFIHNPYMVTLYFGEDDQIERINQTYLAAKDRVETALKEKNWERFIFSHERAYRIGALEHVLFGEEVSASVASPLIAQVWIDSDNIVEFRDEWMEIWASEGYSRSLVMDEDETEIYDALDDMVTIYRGYSVEGGEHGMSWSLSMEKADRFAAMASSLHKSAGRYVASGKVAKSDVLAYFSRRNEDEIVVDPDNVLDMVKTYYGRSSD